MKVTIKTEDLLQPLKAHLVLTKDKCTNKTLNCCRLFADKEDFGFGKVLNIKSVSLNNDPVLCKTKSICDVEEEGAALVNCKELYKFVLSQKKSKTITICTSERKDAWKYLDVIAGTSKVTLKQYDLSEFPCLEGFYGFSAIDNGIAVKACDFITAIDRARLCLSKDESKMKYCNYFLDAKDDNVILISCNRYQLSCNKVQIFKTSSPILFKENCFGKRELISVDPCSLECVSKLFSNSNYLEIIKKDDYLCITDYVSKVVVKCKAETFDYESVIPKLDAYSKFYVRKDDLKRSIKIVSRATDKKRTIGLSFKEDCLKIFTTENFAKYSCSEDVEYESISNYVAGIIGFDYKFLLNAIEKMGRYIFIYALDEDSPIIIENSSCDGCVQVVMPKQI
jgi:DNA polymerase III sliding clamp (beta) subunit (PCNA family)